MYLNKLGKAFGFESSMLTNLVALLNCLSILPLWALNATHAVRKWLTISSALWHFGQIGDNALPILHRCTCSSMCPVLSYTSRAIFHRAKPCVSLLNLGEGMEGSIPC